MTFDKKFFGGLAFVATLAAALLAACGRSGMASASGAANAFKDLQGTYAVACAWKGPSTDAESAAVSDDGSVTVGELVGADKASVRLRIREYESPTGAASGDPCAPTRLSWDVIVFGQIRDLGKTRICPGPAGTAVKARVVEFTYRGFDLVKGSVRGMELPLLDTTTQIAYLLDGNRLYLDQGPRDAGGPAGSLGKRFGVRQ